MCSRRMSSLKDGKSISGCESRAVIKVSPAVESRVSYCVIVVVTVCLQVRAVVMNGVVALHVN